MAELCVSLAAACDQRSGGCALPSPCSHATLCQNNILDQTNVTVAVYYGAWPEGDIQTTSFSGQNAESLSRKLAAVNRLANTVLGFPGENSSQLQGGGRSAMFPNLSFRKMGVQTCSEFKANEVWSSTP